ncbi:MAG: hypothetical protein K6G90_03220 [Clostridia bacterium]|nr:hypothetical protein [Clostridia bacterium]
MKKTDMRSVRGADRVGRRIPDTVGRRDRLVGIFYFVCNSSHSAGGPVDVSKVIAEDPTAATDMDHPAWTGGAYWGEPLFGYYMTEDEWVIRKHIEMLGFADVDFLVFDTTNRVIFYDQVTKIMSLLEEYIDAGYPAPKVVFYTNTEAGETVNELYDRIYSKGLYRSTWFELDGKPLIIDRPEECRPEAREFFTHRISQWPLDEQHEEGFPWMEFIRPQRVYRKKDGTPEVVNVSVAQHPNCAHSDSAFFGEDGAWGRSYHNGRMDIRENAVQYGFNFAEQCEYALKVDPEIVFVTGWNEWTAGQWRWDRREPFTYTVRNDEGEFTYYREGIQDMRAVMCDCCSLEYSRDIEPMKGGYFDNYYMQLVEFIRRYKGGDADPTDEGDGLVYSDYPAGALPRDTDGNGNTHYREPAGANDIRSMTVKSTDDSVIFTAECADAIRREGNYMRLYVVPAEQEHYGSVLAPYKTKTYIFTPDGTAQVYLNKEKAELPDVRVYVDGAVIRYEIPKKLLCLPEEGGFALDFKWADSIKADDTVEDFYLHGDTAPYGRLCYRYRFAEERTTDR